MKNAFLDFLRSSLIPELGSDVATGSAGHVHFVLVGVAAMRAFPDKLMVFIFFDLDFTFKSAYLAVIGLCIQLRIHDVVIDMLKQGHDSRKVVLHIRNFYVGDGSSRREFLELSFHGQLGESVDWLGYMDMVRVGDVVAVSNVFNDSETILQLFGELISG